MAKWYGLVGYAETVNTRPGIWEETIVEKPYYGELIRNSRMLQASGSVNDNVNISNEISIISDPYANEHFYAIRYVTFQGSRWRVSNINVAYPRLILTIGGLYNGDTSGASDDSGESIE